MYGYCKPSPRKITILISLGEKLKPRLSPKDSLLQRYYFLRQLKVFSVLLDPSLSLFSVQFSRSVVFDPLQPHRTAARQASLSINNSRSPPKPMSIESMMPPNHLILCCPLLLLPSIFPSIRVFSSESALCIKWPKYWSFNFNISPSNEHPGLISFRMDWLDLLAVQGTLKSLQHHSSKPSIFWCSAFFTVQLSHPYMTTGKTIALIRWTFVGKVMSLFFNMPSRLVITFFPRSKHLLISWLQSTSAVILEPPKIKSDTASTVFPSICHEVMGPDAMILVFWMLSFKPTFLLSSFTFIKRFFSSSLLSAITVVSSAYLRLLIFLPAILIPACASSSPAFLMMYSAYKLNKPGDNVQPWRTPLLIWNQFIVPCPVLTVAPWPAHRFLRKQVSWSGVPISWRICHSLLWSTQSKTLAQSIKQKSMFFWKLLLFQWPSRCWQFDLWFLWHFFFFSPLAFSKSSLNIWKFTVHVLLKPALENFEHYFASMRDECNCMVVWTFFGTALLWDWNENWPFPVLWPLLSFPNFLAYCVQHTHRIIF